tara:strand:+ start:836 stop:1003 length:168 start_codon:yes stop_codon:yes gene_type:complete
MLLSPVNSEIYRSHGKNTIISGDLIISTNGDSIRLIFKYKTFILIKYDKKKRAVF